MPNSQKEESHPHMKNIISNILALSLLAGTLTPTGFLFFKLKATVTQWLFLNPCSISSTTFLIGFVIYKFSGNHMIQFIGVPPMLFFGITGLFRFPWTGVGFFVQMTHLIMLASACWAIYLCISQEKITQLRIGLLLGVLFFAPFSALQKNYEANNPGMIELMNRNR
jgi:hypothetical protein